MNEAPISEKRVSPRGKGTGDNEFEEAFRPKKSNINFGTLKNEKKKKTGKKTGFPLKKRIVLPALVLLLAVSGAALYFSGFLTSVLASVGLAEPVGGTGASLEERKTDLDTRETALDAREESLDRREKQLAAREAEQEGAPDDSLAGSRTFQEALKDVSDEKQEELKRIGAIYSKMDPEEAAAVMKSMYDVTEISIIIYYMQPAASALVLGRMEAGLAADVTRTMLS